MSGSFIGVFEILVLCLLLAFYAIWGSYEYYQLKTGVATFPSMPSVRRKMIELLKGDAALSKARPYTILDLGSGSGQLSWHVARAMPEAHVIGIEVSYIPWLRSVLRQKLFGPINLEFRRMSFWDYECSSANAVLVYLVGKVMEQASQKLSRELKPGALILANGFALGADWQPQEIFKVGSFYKMKVFVYRQH